MTTSIETYSGLYFDYDDPKPEQVCLADIARALSWTCRFGGHVSRGITVAEHAVLVYEEVCRRTRDEELRLAALHHDSHEAYLGDIPTPLKALLGPRYRGLVWSIDDAIGCWLGIDLVHLTKHPIIKEADAQAMRHEAYHVKRSQGAGEHWGFETPLRNHLVECRLPDSAEALFQRMHVRAIMEMER